MAITVCGNCIEFGGSYTLCSTAPGFSFDGVIKAASGFSFLPTQAQGSVSGYVFGGIDPAAGTDGCNKIHKFPFVSDSPTSLVGTIGTAEMFASSGSASSTHGYDGGHNVNPSTPTNNICCVIEKFPFASDTNATFVGNLTNIHMGSGSSSTTHGYKYSGEPVNPGPPFTTDFISKYPFSSDTNSTDVGEVSHCKTNHHGFSSREKGFDAGGAVRGGPTAPDTFGSAIDSYPFLSDVSATYIADLSQGRNDVASMNSAEHGYITAGTYPSTDTIEQFSFASENPATDVGELNGGNRQGATGSSSITHGYSVGGSAGSPPPPIAIDTITKFDFATGSSSSDVGEVAHEIRSANQGNVQV